MKHREESLAILTSSASVTPASLRAAGASRRLRIQTNIGLLAIALASLVAGAGCGAEASDAPGFESTAAASQTLTKTVNLEGRQVAVDLEFTAAVSPSQAQALLDAIQVFPKDADPNLDAMRVGAYGYSEVSADPSRELRSSVPALSVRLRAADPASGIDNLAWSWPASAFPPSVEPGVVLSADALGTKSSSDVTNIYTDILTPGLAPTASVKTKWLWFGARFDVYLNKTEACAVAFSGNASGVIGNMIPQPYGTLVAIGIKLQTNAVANNVGEDGVRLKVFGPVSPTPGIIFGVDRRGAATTCK
jgi:hypothetical protein